MIENLEAVFWDFDGVLIDSNAVRDLGFELVLTDYPKEEVERLMQFHRANGGLSRYVKFRYFFEVIRGEIVTEEEVNMLAGKFSQIMFQHLSNHNLLIQETLGFIKNNYVNLPMFVVSGSDQTELRALCTYFDIAKYFRGIFGSPTPKVKNVSDILSENTLKPNACLLIGDSINDYEAAIANQMHFMAYNNAALDSKTNFSISFN